MSRSKTMKAVIYRLDGGEIQRFVDCPPDHIDIQCQDGEEFFLNCPDDATHIINNEPVHINHPPPTTEQLLSKIRVERNQLLSVYDWTQLPDAPLSLEEKQAWAVYRQQLRDFPDNCDINNPIFPVKPTGE